MEEKNLKIFYEMWGLQKKFNENFINFNISDDEKQNITKDYVLHLISESDEILREINWKMHKRKDILKIDKHRLLEELVDVQKYWLSMMVLWNFTPEEFIEEFYRKSFVVEQKYHQEIKLNLIDDKNVVGVDIDGVLANYPESFIKFISKKTKYNLDNFSYKNYRLYDELSNIIPGGKEKIKELKHEYRIDGYKRFIPLIDGAVNGMKYLKEKGYTIVLLTSRPFKQYERMFADTMEWLKNNDVVYDAILWDDNKEEKIAKEFPNMKFMIEDCLENAIKLSEKGYKVYLFDKTYNQGDINKNILRINGWDELIKNEVQNE